MKKKRLIYEINTARHSLMKYLDGQSREILDVSVVQMTEGFNEAEIETVSRFLKHVAHTFNQEN